jgi:hypothetical protein
MLGRSGFSLTAPQGGTKWMNCESSLAIEEFALEIPVLKDGANTQPDQTFLQSKLLTCGADCTDLSQDSRSRGSSQFDRGYPWLVPETLY